MACKTVIKAKAIDRTPNHAKLIARLERRVTNLEFQLSKKQESKVEVPELEELSKTELYNMACNLEIAGRSNMNKEELIEALETHG